MVLVQQGPIDSSKSPELPGLHTWRAGLAVTGGPEPDHNYGKSPFLMAKSTINSNFK